MSVDRQIDIEELKLLINAETIIESPDGDLYAIVPLMFHVAVMINPVFPSGYEDRYCYANQDIASLAIKESLESGQPLRYWQKHHTANISVQGGKLYKGGEMACEETCLGDAGWDEREIQKKYPYKSFLTSTSSNTVS